MERKNKKESKAREKESRKCDKEEVNKKRHRSKRLMARE